MSSGLVRTVLVAAALPLSFGPAAARGLERLPIGPLQQSFELLGVDDGLASGSVNDLEQDADGNLWIATHEGVARYDGERIESFGRHDGLRSQFVFDLETDGEGSVWAATLKGLARLEGKRFVMVELSGSPPAEAVESLGLDGDGRLLAGATGGVWRCSRQACERLFETAERQLVSAIALDSRLGDLWFAGTFGLARWNGRLIERWDSTRGLPDAPIRALLVDRRGRIWIRLGHDTIRLDPGTGGLATVPGLPSVSDRSRLFEDRQGTIWATSDHGLFRHVAEGWQRLGAAEGLPADSISALLEDFEGSLWLGTAYDGVARWRGRERFTAWTRASGLPSEVVWAVTRTSDARLVFGTGVGLAWAEPARGELTRLSSRELPGATILAIEPDAASGVWIGTEEGGLAYVDGRGRVSDIGRRQEFPAALSVLAIESTADGTVWLGTTWGVWRGRGAPESIRFRREPIVGEPATSPGLPPAESFHDLHLDRDGTLWATGRYGLARFAGGAWRRFARADGLADDFVISIDQTGDGVHWLAYRDPLGVSELRFDGDRPVVRQFDRRQGLAHDQVMFVRVDTLDRLWVGTTRGLSVWSGDRFASFDRRDGMRGDDLGVNAFHADPDGTVWVGTTRGALAIRLSSQDLGPPQRPAARIRTAALGGIPFELDGRPEVSSEQGNFEVEFGAKTFLRAPRELEYRYQLKGVDQEPVTTSSRSHTYGALAPGRYEFLVEARLRGGGWGAPDRAAFTIRPPWWGRAPAQIAALAAAALFGVLVDRVRSRRTRRRQQELELAVATRTGELQASREELARKNDELGLQALTDPLTGLKNRRYAWELLADEVQRVDREWRAAPPGGEPEARLVFFLMDVDLFKEINDRHGHEVGDQILIEAAERVRAATRLTDVAIRWGGEEFLIVARDLPKSEWAGYAARLREAVATPPYRPSKEIGEVTCTSSLGYSAYPFDQAIGIRWQQVLHLADLALYAAKQCGRNADLGVEPGAGWTGSVPVDLLASQMSGALLLRWSSPRARRR